jgi:hypothetical protein
MLTYTYLMRYCNFYLNENLLRLLKFPVNKMMLSDYLEKPKKKKKEKDRNEKPDGVKQKPIRK